MNAPADPFYESREWLDLRYRVLSISNGSCALCGDRGSADNPIQCDHIIPRSKRPDLALVASNLQVLCRRCNLGKSNKDTTDWRWKASNELSQQITRKVAVLERADALQKAKLEQLGWLRRNDVSEATRKEAERQYQALWREIENDWLSSGGGS